MKNRRIELKTPAELAIMDRCNALVLGVLAEIGARIRPGVDIADLDAYAAQRTREAGARAAFKGYHGYPATLCVSINEQVVHGIPRRRLLRAGDIVSVDFGVFLEDFTVFRDDLVVEERRDGLSRLRVLPWHDGEQAAASPDEHEIRFDEPAYSAGIGDNPEVDSKSLRFYYSSMTTPVSVINAAVFPPAPVIM